MGTETAERAVEVKFANVISAEQTNFFVDNGYLVLENLLVDDEVQALKDDIISLARGRYPCAALQPVAAGLTDAEVVEKILCIHQPHNISEVILKYVKHARICGVLSQIVGAHLAHWDGRVKAMQSMLFIKPPGLPGQAWHQDEIYIPTRDRSLCGAWIAIDDATTENGCLWIVPGSHRMGLMYDTRAVTDLAEFDGSPEAFGFDEGEEIPVEVPAGSVVFFNGYLLHRSKRNRTAGNYRRVLVSHYMNSWSLLPWQLKQGGVGAADCRKVVPVAGQEPYTWKPLETAPESTYLRGYGQDKFADFSASHAKEK